MYLRQVSKSQLFCELKRQKQKCSISYNTYLQKKKKNLEEFLKSIQLTNMVTG